MSIVVKCNDFVIMEHDGRRSELHDAPLNMEHGNHMTEETHVLLQLQHALLDEVVVEARPKVLLW